MTNGCVLPSGSNSINTELIREAGNQPWHQAQLMFGIAGLCLALLALIPCWVIKKEEEDDDEESRLDVDRGSNRQNALAFSKAGHIDKKSSKKEITNNTP